MGRLVWLFREHRELYQVTMNLQRDNEGLYRKVADLEKQLRERPTAPANLTEVLEQVFAEAPFPDGRIPDNIWLTPEVDSARDRN